MSRFVFALAFRSSIAGLAFAITLASAASAQSHLLWSAQFDGVSHGSDTGVSVVADAFGNSYVIGTSIAPPLDFSSIVTNRYDTNGQLLWTRYFAGPNVQDSASGSAIDAAGNVFVVGTESPATGALGGRILKYDSSGNLLWSQLYTGSHNNGWRFTKVATDTAGHVFAVGETVGANSALDIDTVAYDSNGNQLWARSFDGPASGEDYAAAIAIGGTGNVYVGGSSAGIATGLDFAVIAYDASGNLLWSSLCDGGGKNEDILAGIGVDQFGSVYATGKSKMTGYGVTTDYLTVKFQYNGSVLWTRRYNGPLSDIDTATAIAVSPQGDVFVSGQSAVSSVSDDITTIRYDLFGTLVWTNSYAGTANSDDGATALVLDGAGHLYLTGHSFELTSGGGGGSADIVTIAYDIASASPKWIEIYDGPHHLHDQPAAMTIDGLGNVHVVGSSEGDIISLDYGAFCTGSVTNYCTAQTNSLGCVPSIALNGVPSASLGSGCMLVTSNLIGHKTGVYFHGTHGGESVPFHTGLLCVKPPLKRHPITNSGGTQQHCDGAISEDFNAYIASGADPALFIGASVWIQCWSRDPITPFGDNLSDGVTATICW